MAHCVLKPYFRMIKSEELAEKGKRSRFSRYETGWCLVLAQAPTSTVMSKNERTAKSMIKEDLTFVRSVYYMEFSEFGGESCAWP